MAVKIRLMRIGTNRQPFYRVVAVDERKKRTGGYLELLGTYNPLSEPKEINLKQDRIDEWIKKGAIPSYGFLRIIGKAPQRAPRKAKKPARNASPARNDAAISGEQSDAGEEKKTEPSAEKAPENSENSVNPEIQNVSKPENQKPEISETPAQSDSTDSLSSSESSEPETKPEEQTQP